MRYRTGMLALMFLTDVASAARAPSQSWSKPGVTFDQYRSDSIDCALVGYNRNVSNDKPAKRFIRGWRSGEDALANGDPGAWQRAILRTQPDRQRKAVHSIQVGDVERCLTEKGYMRFTLSPDEERVLRRFRAGSTARHQYLHRLAAAARPG